MTYIILILIAETTLYLNYFLTAQIGGYMGMLVGASLLTVFEFIDLVICRGILRRNTKETSPDDSNDNSGRKAELLGFDTSLL